MPAKSIPISEARIDLKSVKALTPEQRYTYYLLGLIANETMCLRKLIRLATPDHSDIRAFRREAEMSQCLFLFRIACSKVHEARVALEKQPTQTVLRQDVYPVWREGKNVWRELSTAMSSAKWLPTMRHSIGFHYPSLTEWRSVTTAKPDWDDDFIYYNDTGGNVFFAASEAITRAWMFGETANQDSTRKIVEEMVALVVLMNQFVEHGHGYFMINRLGCSKAKPVGHLHARPLSEQSIPFWVTSTK